MAKGKYKARAANVLAHTENELLRQKSAEAEDLRRELGDVRAELSELRRDFNAAAMRHGSELARSEISSLKEDLKSLEEQFHNYRGEVARQCWELYREFGATLGEDASFEEYFSRYVELFALSKSQEAELRIISSPTIYNTSRFARRAARKRDKLVAVHRSITDNPGLRINECGKDEQW